MEASAFIKKGESTLMCITKHTHTRTHTSTVGSATAKLRHTEISTAGFFPYLGPHLTPKLHKRQITSHQH